MALSHTPIYLSTLLLEKNRWNGKGPTLLVSDWMDYIAEAGFVGVEIWFNHLQLSSRSEWELILEKSRELDLTIASLHFTLPGENSLKSKKIKDVLFEAYDYFEPDSLKFSVDPLTKLSELPNALNTMRTWANDLSKNMNLLCELDASLHPRSSEALDKITKLLKPLGMRLVLRPFLLSLEEVKQISANGLSGIGQIGVQSQNKNQWALLEENKINALQTIALIKENDFNGSWCLEFTQGVGKAKEDIDELFDNAEKDFNFISNALSTRKTGIK